jgi:hypothetical protein
MGDSAEAEADPEVGRRKLNIKMLNIEANSETLRTMSTPR